MTRARVISRAMLLLCLCLPAAARAQGVLQLNPNEKIVLIGNTLAERMQYDNDWESHLHARFPKHHLTVRNLGYSGDTITVRLRSNKNEDHGNTLLDHQPHVILAFFGFNESFAGTKGLPQFEKDLKEFVAELKKLHYPIHKVNRNAPAPADKRGDAERAPRIVLCSPIPNEDLPEREILAGKQNNANILAYAGAIKKIAGESEVGYVDLYAHVLRAMESSAAPLTVNGCHLNAAGHQALTTALDRALFGETAPVKVASMLRDAVADKNQQFFYDYRAVNGCYIYGQRENPYGVVNFPAEFEKLRKMTVRRDERIWAIANGETVPAKVDDSQTGELAAIQTNIGNRKITQTSPEESLKMMTLAKGFEATVFASEVEFPNLQDPVQFTFDARGRMWVVTMPTYPQYLPGEPVHDKVLIYEDTNGDGKADKETVFADNLYLPTGIEIGDGGVYIGQQPNLMFLKDTNGDDVADVRELKLHGFDSADSHHAIHTFEFGPEGALYFQEGTFHHSQVESPYGLTRLANAGVYRYEPQRDKVEVFLSAGFANPWGHAFDRWGQDVIGDASPGRSYFAAAGSGQVDFPNKHPMPPEYLKQHTRPSCGNEFIHSRNFPDDMQGDYLVPNCIGFQGILQYRPEEKGSSIFANQVDPLLRSEDINFRPVDLQFGPDGALYVVDWYNPLVGHMQHSLRDPNRDHAHGRIYRIRHVDKPLVTPAKIAGEPIPALLELLKLPELRTRYRARTELRSRPKAEVLAAVDRWIAGLDKADEQFEHNLLEAMWVKRHHMTTDVALLDTLLAAKDGRARAAAVRALSQQLDKVDDPLAKLQKTVHDDHPRVRLETIRALSFFNTARAVDIAVESLVHDQDPMLEYTLKETLDTLQKRVAAGTAQQ